MVNSSVFLGHVVHELVCILIVLRQTGLQQRLNHISVVRFHGDRQRRAPVVQRLIQFGAELHAQKILQFTIHAVTRKAGDVSPVLMGHRGRKVNIKFLSIRYIDFLK